MITLETILELFYKLIDDRNDCQAIIDGLNDEIDVEWEFAMVNDIAPDIAHLRHQLRRYEARLATIDNIIDRTLASLHPEHKSMLNALGVS